ncbi:hypothetical protein [Defluviimonas sp. SAOS-178_SWC]|uniref:hypothetical protein n=1 Tax=Defluviimonas sp. SAOS-178_SWC TaxID=3121287 RepID=UPI0032216F6D
MQMDTFGYLRQARRPGTYLALGIAMVAVYLSFTLTLNALVPVLAVLYLALVLARLIRNPGRGFRLGPNRIDWFTRKGRQSASLDDLIGVAIGNGTTGQTVCVLRLADGRTVPLSGVEKFDQGALMREFGRRGIRIMA